MQNALAFFSLSVGLSGRQWFSPCKMFFLFYVDRERLVENTNSRHLNSAPLSRASSQHNSNGHCFFISMVTTRCVKKENKLLIWDTLISSQVAADNQLETFCKICISYFPLAPPKDNLSNQVQTDLKDLGPEKIYEDVMSNFFSLDTPCSNHQQHHPHHPQSSTI